MSTLKVKMDALQKLIEMDKIFNDQITSLKGESVVDFTLYEPKNIIEQMSALKVKMNALQELIKTENTTPKMVEDQSFL